jgi:hypothetical protein
VSCKKKRIAKLFLRICHFLHQIQIRCEVFRSSVCKQRTKTLLHKAVNFLAYEGPSGMALACMAMCFSALALVFLGDMAKYQDTPIVKANNWALS